MKVQKGSELVEIAPKNEWIRIDFFEGQLRGKILVDEAELRGFCKECEDFEKETDMKVLENCGCCVIKEILGE